MGEIKRLGFDLSSLFPSETFKVTDECSVEIFPLSFSKFARVSKKLKDFVSSLTEKGITKANFSEPGNFLEIASTVITEFPELLEETSGISREDLQEFPIDKIVALLEVIVSVNIKSKDKLLKNWQSLAEKMGLPLLIQKPPLSKQSKN